MLSTNVSTEAHEFYPFYPLDLPAFPQSTLVTLLNVYPSSHIPGSSCFSAPSPYALLETSLRRIMRPIYDLHGEVGPTLEEREVCFG